MVTNSISFLKVDMQVDGTDDESLLRESDSDESLASVPEHQIYSKDELVSLELNLKTHYSK